MEAPGSAPLIRAALLCNLNSSKRVTTLAVGWKRFGERSQRADGLLRFQSWLQATKASNVNGSFLITEAADVEAGLKSNSTTSLLFFPASIGTFLLQLSVSVATYRLPLLRPFWSPRCKSNFPALTTKSRFPGGFLWVLLLHFLVFPH